VDGDPVSAAVAVARAHGLQVGEPVVLRAAWHVLVHLSPAPVVARVTSGAPGVDPGDVERELRVAVHAARRGAPVIEPTDLLDPGPHERDGRTMVFWRYVEQRGQVDPAAAGRALGQLHDALADFDGELPRAGRQHDVASMLAGLEPSPDVELLRELAARELPSGQALHGDAHLHNCMSGLLGPVWHDLETSCRGPREYDLAALLHGHRVDGDDSAGSRALEAYGAHDRELLDVALIAYTAWIAASWLVALPRRPALGPRLERQLAYLRSHRG
jgi:hypothetical protein